MHVHKKEAQLSLVKIVFLFGMAMQNTATLLVKSLKTDENDKLKKIRIFFLGGFNCQKSKIKK
jgi:hypothetical protein